MELTKKQMANMRNVSQKLSDMEGVKEVVAAFTEDGEEVDKETGVVNNVRKGYLAMADGTYYGTISETAVRNIEDVIDILNDGDTVRVEVVTRKSSKGRDFITLELS